MKKKIKRIWTRLQRAVRQHPVEMLLALVFCVLGCFYDFTHSTVVKDVIPYFPVFFLTTCLLNRLTMGQKGRWLYVLSLGFFLPFLGIELERGSVTYWVSLTVVQLLYLISSRARDNERFVRFGLSYLGAVLVAWLLTSITWLLAQSVNYSIRYIFEVGGSYSDDFMRYSTSIAFLGLMPLLFLMFSEKEEQTDYGDSKVFEVLLNYVLSPVLLIYALILYLYVIKIAVLWSLPKGEVAYIVVSFVSAAFLLKGCQPLLRRRWYDWFYDRTALAVLPALALYWIGASYRIHEYGFTVARVYLVVVGVVLTGTALLFFSRRTGRYLYAASLAVAALAVVTYIPGIKAKDMERISQTKRGNFPLKEKGYDNLAFFHIYNNGPVDCKGYTAIFPLRPYQVEGEEWMAYTDDTLFFYGSDGQVLWSEPMEALFSHQLAKAGLSHSDTIPETLYPLLLEMETDSAKYVFEEMTLTKDSVYHVTYIRPAFYLKR